MRSTMLLHSDIIITINISDCVKQLNQPVTLVKRNNQWLLRQDYSYENPSHYPLDKCGVKTQ